MQCYVEEQAKVGRQVFGKAGVRFAARRPRMGTLKSRDLGLVC